MKLYNLIAVVFLFSPTCHSATVDHHTVDVAVIGGGSSGIHATINLKDAGAKVAVIERKKQIGTIQGT
jgi:ribulose 1,5-bisphosphate synthetase/thiazole synthase